ncbi:MAG TPA: hypothetical protein VF487_13605 [Chitinophagaceae bacterium]
MKLHIGEIIKKVAKTVKIENMDKFCSEHLNMTKQNYYRIIKEETINTDVLLKFCSAFKHDFFQYYYNVEPLKSLSKSEIKKLREENQDLHLAIQRKEDLVKDYERKIALMKEENESLKKSATTTTRKQKN